MSDYSAEAQDRLEKLNELKKADVIPYSSKYERTHNISQVLDKFNNDENIQDADDLIEQWADNEFVISGRLVSFRTHGRISFGDIQDGQDEIQLCFFRWAMSFNTWREKKEENIQIDWEELSIAKFVKKYIDVWDFIGVKGQIFVTDHGEKTLFINELQLLSKAVRPLPEKFHGLQDKEKLYRQRYLDLIANQDSYDRMQLRSEFLKELRKFYWKHDFKEVETPVLCNAASGAAAEPFITHHNDFDQDFFLRISPETALKKATVGRFEKIFEVAKDFRNEGSDPSHMQEFTMVEHYAVYWDFKDNMEFTEQMFDHLFDNLDLDRKVQIPWKDWDSKEIDFSTPWKRIDYIQGIKDVCGIDVSKYGMEDRKELREAIKEKDIHFEGMDEMGTTTLIDYLFKKVLRPDILWPAFVYNYPKTMQPLARVSDENEDIVQQFQVVVNGWEIVKAYSELVDPQLQKENFEKQAEAIKRGDEEATASDDEFLRAMEYGMPPQSGFGMGIDRILALLTGQSNLRDTVLFPLVNPKNDE